MTPADTEEVLAAYAGLAVVRYRGRDLKIEYLAYSGWDVPLRIRARPANDPGAPPEELSVAPDEIVRLVKVA